MKRSKTGLAVGAGLITLVGVWLALAGVLFARSGDAIPSPQQQPAGPSARAVATGAVPTYTHFVHMPLIQLRHPELPEKIAFEALGDRDYDIFLMNPDGSDQTNLTQSLDTKDVAPAWSPDGRRLAFVSDRDGVEEIYVMNRDGSGVVRLTHNDALDGWPTWSPDGSRIAFQSKRTGNYEIFVMNADGSGQTQITHEDRADRWPDWSPDGTRIAFVSSRWDTFKRVFTMNPDGGNLSLVSERYGYYVDRYPTWTPDGRLTVTSDRPAPSDGSRDDEIYLMNADGSNVQQLTNNDAGDWLARWSPDGTQFAFYTDRDGDKNIYVKTLSTGEETQITDTPHDEEYPAWSP